MNSSTLSLLDRAAGHFGYLIDMDGVIYRGSQVIPGAVVAMLETAAGVKAFSVGKPSPVMLRAARKEIGLTTDQTIVIGDTMETDILGGVQLGFRTVLVLSGGTKAEDLPRYPYQRDVVVQSIGELDHGGVLERLRTAAA